MGHEEVTIAMPAAACTDGVDILCHSNLLVTFDGGAAGKKGTGGFLVWGPNAELLHVDTLCYGDNVPTNNVAEALAALDTLEWVVRLDKDGTKRVVVLSDS